jgi:hypothetical protein
MLVKHNPDFKLIEKMVYDGNGKYINLVYGISNEGNNEGLEAYYYRSNNKAEHFYRSYRWVTNDIPTKYKENFETLKSHIEEVPEGHMLTL